MGVTHNLPLDILRLLLEYSASASIDSARALSLVSKDVQHWIDPYLFQNMQGLGIEYSSEIYRTSLVDWMCLPDASPRLVFARRYVRTVAWEKHVPHNSSIKQVLESFPSLAQLCLWKNIFPHRPNSSASHSQYFEITQRYPSLRRIATCTFDTSSTPPNAFGSPFWMTITHLQIRCYTPISSSRSPLQLPLFATMASLTHLALSSEAGGGEADADLALSRVRATFPLSLSLCLLGMRAPTLIGEDQWCAEMVTACLKVDARIVVWSTGPVDKTDGQLVANRNGSDTFQAWCGIHDSVQTFWEMGEAIMKKRRERLRLPESLQGTS
ncbi:hypothetical protein DL96DRAFT_1708095 [Flagelloscypha sp. PMI_526]|nr:hypothetical protein DL96DRAFT_1708095 [Flagelloscypha sp. PMI_526]